MNNWSSLVQLFLMDCKSRNLTKPTIRRYGNGLKKLEQHLNTQHLEWFDLTPDLLKHRIIPSMLDETSALRTVNCNLAIIKAFFAFLVAEKQADCNIADGLKPFKIQPSLMHTFTDAHLTRLFTEPDRSTFTGFRNYMMLLILLETGIRLNELTQLQITDVLLEEGMVRVRQGKGRKARMVPIQRIVSHELQLYLLERGTLDTDRLWITLDNRPFDEGGIRSMISRICKTANIQDVQCSCHTFRHTFAKKFLLNGGDIFSLKNILGHSRIETTEMYVELFSRDLQTQHEKFSPLEQIFQEYPSLFAESGVQGE
ncbi:tyrosine-type recombinase/integrase [Paenibacillus sp. N3.4]|uniref:tyrosine-type recombinase/integrase n=1 Tax=Paenibacillus sp. N3.4 TaxID=2603222 RepID=UPI0011C9CD85|nr:tyrosine-type recombinase/integrase [Paenibacillus sp. N3.4]TXK80705.1 tyrosine-type recombinase/integrase [Paenibacillus sp. N3.4]